MAFRPMQPARTQGSAGDVPDVVNLPVNGAETWLKGTVVKLSSGNAAEVTVDTDNGSLYGVTLAGAASGDPDGAADEVPIARINDETYFVCHVIDSSGPTVLTDLSSLSVGDQGDLEVHQDTYMFDSNSNASAALEIEAVLDDLDLVLVSFIPTVVA